MKKNFYIHIWLGFVDGEGSISISSLGSQKQAIVKITVVNTVESIIQLFQNEFGGHIRKRVWKNSKWKPCYEWRLSSDKAITVLEQIRPYLRIKSRQAELCIQLQELRKNRTCHARWHPEEYLKSKLQIDKLKEECKKLNERGISNK